MVKIKIDDRLKVLEKMLNNAKTSNIRMPKVELEYKNLLKKKRKGNKDLFQF